MSAKLEATINAIRTVGGIDAIRPLLDAALKFATYAVRDPQQAVGWMGCVHFIAALIETVSARKMNDIDMETLRRMAESNVFLRKEDIERFIKMNEGVSDGK